MFENLSVYQKAVDFAEQILTLTESFPRGYYFLADQLNRASLSIAANLAEGNGRFTKADRKNFFIISRVPAQECVPILELARRKNLLSAEVHRAFREQIEVMAKMTNSRSSSRARQIDDVPRLYGPSAEHGNGTPTAAMFSVWPARSQCRDLGGSHRNRRRQIARADNPRRDRVDRDAAQGVPEVNYRYVSKNFTPVDRGSGLFRGCVQVWVTWGQAARQPVRRPRCHREYDRAYPAVVRIPKKATKTRLTGSTAG